MHASPPLKTRIYQILFGTKENNTVDKTVGFLLMGLILLNVICVMLETVEDYAADSRVFNSIEVVTVSIFTIEYILRLGAVFYIIACEYTPFGERCNL